TPTRARAVAAKPAPAAPSAHGPAAGVAPNSTAPTLLSVTRQIAAEQHRLTLRDQRITARRRLADVYGQWDAIVAGQGSAVLHARPFILTLTLAAILLLLFADLLLD